VAVHKGAAGIASEVTNLRRLERKATIERRPAACMYEDARITEALPKHYRSITGIGRPTAAAGSPRLPERAFGSNHADKANFWSTSTSAQIAHPTTCTRYR